MVMIKDHLSLPNTAMLDLYAVREEMKRSIIISESSVLEIEKENLSGILDLLNNLDF